MKDINEMKDEYLEKLGIKHLMLDFCKLFDKYDIEIRIQEDVDRVDMIVDRFGVIIWSCRDKVMDLNKLEDLSFIKGNINKEKIKIIQELANIFKTYDIYIRADEFKRLNICYNDKTLVILSWMSFKLLDIKLNLYTDINVEEFNISFHPHRQATLHRHIFKSPLWWRENIIGLSGWSVYKVLLISTNIIGLILGLFFI